jgi:large subunit ribosomal protein L9e
MKLVYAHFPINATCSPANDSIQIKNFLGGKQIKHVDMIPGVIVKMADIKDEIHFEGFDNAAVSLCCARVS